MKAATFLSACLFVFSASADYVWPTATTGKDGNMASNGADGWNGGMPNGTGTTWFYGAGTYTPYLSCGTELFLSPTVCLRNRSSVDESHVTLDISGLGTHMIFHKLQLGDSGDRADSTMKLYVHDGAKVSVTNSLVTKGKNCFFEFRDNAVLDVSSISTPVYLGDSGGSWGPGTGNFTVTNNFLFTDSEMKGNTVFFGYGASWKACPLYICATNSTFKFMDKSSYQSLGKKVFNNCIHTVALSKECHVQYGADVTFDGCAITNGKWSVGNANSATADPPDSFLVVKGGSKAYLQGIAGAESANSTGRILIADPGTEVSMGGATSVYGYTDLGKKGNCYVVVTNGAALRTAGDFPSVQPIRLGVDGGSYGEFIVCGGECTMTNTFGFWVGCSGDGELRVSDGLVRLNRMTVGYNGASTYTRTALVRQTGGTILIDNGGTIDNNGNNAVVLGKVARPSEIRLEGGVFETGSIYSDNRASAVLVGDGGILRRSHADYVSGYSKTKKFVYGLSAVQCGASGLTIDTNGKDVSVDGDFTNKAGDDGVLVKTGAGVMSLKNAAYDVAKTVVCGGTLLLDGASSVLSTDLCVTNDGVFSLVGSATTVTLTGLSIDRGTVAIDPGDKIVVDGRADLSRLKVEFSSLPAVDQEADFLVVDGELSAASQSALRKALFLNVLADGTHGAFAFSYDEGTGKTTVKIAVKTDAPLSDTTQWNGADGSWSVGGNWSAGLPTAAKVAVFTDDSSSAAVSIPSGATVGALSFGGQAYTLSGEALSIPSEEGSAMLTVASGSHEISAPLVVDSTMRVVVETNSAIAVSGSVNGGGVKKTGGGKLSLGADNAFLRPVVLSEGTLAAMTSGALGCSAESDNVVGLASGTLEVTNSTGLATTLGQDIRVVATNATEPVVLKTDTDVVVSSLSVSQGAILKHGRGRLVLQAKDGRTLVPNNWEVVANTTAMVYSASGSVYPRSDGSNRYFYAPLTVSEGEFLLKGTPGEDSTETVKGTVFVGRYVGQGLAGASSMTIDGATLSMPNQIFYLGYSMSDSGDGLDSVLRIVNGGKLNAGRLVLGEYCFGKYVETLACTSATLQAQTVDFSGRFSRATHTRVLAKDSTFAVGSLTMYAAGDGDFDNCSVGIDSGATLSVDELSYTKGLYTFRNGSTLNVKTLSKLGKLTSDLVFEFRDSTWKTSSSVTFSSATASSNFYVRTAGDGLAFTIDIGDGAEFAFVDTVPLTGDGGFRKTGAGTVSFGLGMYAATGAISCEEGVIDFSGAGTLSDVTIEPGAGTIKGATFHGATIRLDSFGGVTPLFQDCTFTGRTKVVVGGAPACMEGATVARYSGTISGISTFRLSGWSGYGGGFSAGDGIVSVDVDVKGAIILVY